MLLALLGREPAFAATPCVSSAGEGSRVQPSWPGHVLDDRLPGIRLWIADQHFDVELLCFRIIMNQCIERVCISGIQILRVACMQFSSFSSPSPWPASQSGLYFDSFDGFSSQCRPGHSTALDVFSSGTAAISHGAGSARFSVENLPCAGCYSAAG